MCLRMSQVLLVSPVILIAISIYLVIVFNWISLAISGIFFLIIGFQLVLNRFTVPTLRKKKELSDKRAKFVNEVITGIKNIKF